MYRMINTKKRKTKTRPGKKKRKLRRKKISQCNLLSVSPNVLVSTTRPLVECSDKRQSTAQVVALRKRERQSLGPPPTGVAEAALLLWSLPQTRLHTALYCTGRQFSSVHVRYTSTGTHTPAVQACSVPTKCPQAHGCESVHYDSISLYRYVSSQSSSSSSSCRTES